MKNFVLKPWVAMSLIFILGALSGAALTFALAPHGPHPPGDKQMEHRWLDHLSTRLSLTSDQRSKIAPILDAASGQFHSVHRDEVDRIGRIFDDVHGKILAVLTPEQQVEFKKMEHVRQDDFSRHRRSWGEHAPPPVNRPPDQDNGSPSDHPPGG